MGTSMWDTSIFARIFQHLLRCRPIHTADFQQKMAHEVQVLSIGLLKMPMIPEQPRPVNFCEKHSANNPLTNRDLTVLDPQYIDAIRPFGLLAIHLQNLADLQLRDRQLEYQSVRELVCEILQQFERNQAFFKDQKEQFERNQAFFKDQKGIPILKQLLPILASSTREEALAAIRSSSSPTQNDQISQLEQRAALTGISEVGYIDVMHIPQQVIRSFKAPQHGRARKAKSSQLKHFMHSCRISASTSKVATSKIT